jgi:hydroxycarboxylate dehydrogenase B
VPRKAATPGTKAATSAQPVTLRAETLARFIERMFIAAGCSAREATQIANCLVRANLYGHDSHGVQMAPIYVDNLAHGLVRAGQTPRVVADHGAIVGLDGQKGFGQAIGEDAMRIAIERASALGCCVLGLSNTHHLGRIGQWAEQCAHAGFASVHFVNALSTPLVAPWGGGDARLSTDPFCVGVPREPEPLILDYATSKVALGKVRVAQDKGARMAPDVLLDAAGRPTDDPATMFADPGGALLSFGEHKGFALAVMCEVLGGALSGGSVQHMRPEVSPMINNMLSLVFAPGKLVSHADLARQVDALAAWLKASPPRAGGTGIHLPGEPERLTAREREERGIPLPKRTCDALVAAARGLGMAGKEFAFLKSSAS